MVQTAAKTFSFHVTGDGREIHVVAQTELAVRRSPAAFDREDEADEDATK